MVEQRIRNAKVIGSNPIIGIFNLTAHLNKCNVHFSFKEKLNFIDDKNYFRRIFNLLHIICTGI